MKVATNLPRKVFRFQRFSAKTIEALCHDQLYFSDPSLFNDPLDCKPSVEADLKNKELRLLLSEQIKRRVEQEALLSIKNIQLSSKSSDNRRAKSLGENSARNEIDRIAYYATNPDYECSVVEAECHLLTCAIQEELLKRYNRGVCCFSSTYDNPLLWSHYGDEHKGICIGYGVNRNPKPKLHKVIYGGNRTVKTSLIADAIIKENPNSQELLDCNVLLRKAAPWRYEREWRLFNSRGARESELRLKDITFGLRCPPAIIHTIISSLETREEEVKFFQIYEVKGSFLLKRKQFDPSDIHYLPVTAKSGTEVFGES